MLSTTFGSLNENSCQVPLATPPFLRNAFSRGATLRTTSHRIATGRNAMTLSFHPLSNIFPLMTGAELSDLTEDIRANGLQEAITLAPDGSILDGRNRYLACERLGRRPLTQEYDGDDTQDAMREYVVSLNVIRRHLNESQRAMAAAALANMPSGARTDLASIEARSQSHAAALLNVSRSTVQRASAVREHGAPSLVRAVEQGNVSVSSAAHVATIPPDIQQGIVERGPRAVQEAARTIRRRSPPSRVALPRALEVYEEARQSHATEMLGTALIALREIAAHANSPSVIKEIAVAALAEIEEDGGSASAPTQPLRSPRSRRAA